MKTSAKELLRIPHSLAEFVMCHVTILTVSLPEEIIPILLRLRYETLKFGRFKVTQINLHFLADQDFQGSLPDSLPNINSIPLKMAN